jgi:hypothetical protein
MRKGEGERRGGKERGKPEDNPHMGSRSVSRRKQQRGGPAEEALDKTVGRLAEG